MAQFSEADINEAKRRVMDMRNRANRYAGISNYQNEQNSQSRKSGAPQNDFEKSQHNEEKRNENSNNESSSQGKAKQNRSEKQGSILGILDGLFDTEKDNSFIIILALILILNKEGADNKLILALLYLLL